MINIVQNNNTYEISFPYDSNLVYLIKNVPSRRWVPEERKWVIDKNMLGMFFNQIKGTKYENIVNLISDEHINQNHTLDATNVISDVDISRLKFVVENGHELYGHQIDTLKYYIDRRNRSLNSGFLLCDEPGLGKTLSVINVAEYSRKKYKYKHCLIVCCVNSSKHNWYHDIIKHSNGKMIPYILGTRVRRDKISHRYDTGGAEKLDDLIKNRMYGDAEGDKLPYFLIVNIEAFRYKVGKKYLFADKIIDMINSGELNMVAVDEIHKNASPSSTQGKQILRIKKSTGAKSEWIPMTGTPIVNKPTDVFLPLKLVDGHSCSSYYKWCQDFCVYGGFGGHDILGYKNIDKLKHMLQSNMLRRLRKDVLDLPPKIEILRYVENTEYQQKLYTKVRDDLISQKDDIVSSLNPVAKLMRLRQVNGSPEIVDRSIQIDKNYISKNAKMNAVLDILSEVHDRKEKIIVFSNWIEPLRTLYRFISKKYNVCYFTGTMSDKERQINKERFMSDPNYTVMIGTIGALGTTHTLTVANNICFLDEPWTASDKEQAEDRIYRIGTSESVNIYTILTKDTVDDRVHNLIYTKSGVSKYIVDGQLDIRRNPDIFNLLLGYDDRCTNK